MVAVHVHAHVEVRMPDDPNVPVYVPLNGQSTLDVLTVPEVEPVGVTVTAPDAAPVPAELVAVTVQLYAVPFVSAVTPMGLAAPVPVRVTPPPPQDAV